jgi:hypothetical protein
MSNKREDFQLIEDENDIKEEEEFVAIYLVQAEKMKTTLRSTMFVDMVHFFEWDRTYELRDLILNDTFRFVNIINLITN